MEIEKETSSLVTLGITLIAIAVVITLGFGIFAVGKRLANSGQNDLVAQVDQVNQAVYTDLDQQTITGTRMKGIVTQMSGQNCALLVATTSFLNAQAQQATMNGNLASDIANIPFVQVDIGKADANTEFRVKTSQGTELKTPILVNYNSILKNAVYGGTNGAKLKVTASGATLDGVAAYDVNAETDKTSGMASQTIQFKDGTFTTKQEYLTKSSRVSKYENKADLTSAGKTMFISDGAKFETYVLKDTAGNYVGLVFFQTLN